MLESISRRERKSFSARFQICARKWASSNKPSRDKSSESISSRCSRVFSF
jgi:hypothetical protein